jgi:hypothetical protein
MRWGARSWRPSAMTILKGWLAFALRMLGGRLAPGTAVAALPLAVALTGAVHLHYRTRT